VAVITLAFQHAGSSHAHFSQFADSLFEAAEAAQLSEQRKIAVKASTDSEIRADRLRAEIAQLEARYDGSFPPGVYSVLESLRQQLVALHKTF
jgi:hypothetical protein